MRFRDQVALTLPALCLRLLLASLFIWAGLAKIITTVPVGPEQAAALDSLGVPVQAAEPAPAEIAVPALPDPDDAEPPAAPVESPATGTTTEPAPASALPDPQTDADANPTDGTLLLTAWAQDDAPPDAQPAESPAEPNAEETTEETDAQRPRTGLVTAADYPEGGTVRMVETLALLIDSAANPPLDEQSNRADPIWPDAIGSGPWPRVLAWAVAITEVTAGLFILIGLLTRLSALSLFGVMLGAMWLTEIGPAMQQSATTLGFLPDHALHDFGAWRPLWMQFSLAMSALALMFLGAGPVSLDRAIFRRSSESFDAGPKYTTATDPPPESRRPV